MAINRNTSGKKFAFVFFVSQDQSADFASILKKDSLQLVTKQEAAYQQSIVKVSEVVHKFSEAISQDRFKLIGIIFNSSIQV